MLEKKTLLAIVSILLAFVLFQCAQYYDAETVNASLKGYLFINELVAASTDSDDWIELYNPTDGAIDLSGFWLSDDLLVPKKWSFPNGTVVLPRGYIVVRANNHDKGLDTNFRLGANEAVVLTTPGGTTTIDSIDYTSIDVPAERSFGRNPDGGSVWMTFPNPTKGSANL
jgi:hypothetical protein